jgi:glutathionylspermidine amidase/synthetase
VRDENTVPYNVVLGVASSNVRAYSNGDDTFYSNESHVLHGTYMGMKWQCVEFARRWTFLRKSSIFESVDGADDMWNQLKYVERVTDKARFPLRRHDNGSPNLPKNDSYLIYRQQKDMPYGHVAVIIDVLPSAIRIAEQNFNFNYWSADYARQIPVTFNNGRYFVDDQYEVYGWMQIDDKQQLQPYGRTSLAKPDKRVVEQLSSRSMSAFASRSASLAFVVVLFSSSFVSRL